MQIVNCYLMKTVQHIIVYGPCIMMYTHTHTHTHTHSHTHTHTHMHTHIYVVGELATLREESSQTNVQITGIILSAVCSVIQQS